MVVPTWLLMGDREMICDPSSALFRARRLIPHLEGQLVPGCSHNMTIRRHSWVDAQVVDFLKRYEGPVPNHAIPEP